MTEKQPNALRYDVLKRRSNHQENKVFHTDRYKHTLYCIHCQTGFKENKIHRRTITRILHTEGTEF